MDETTMREAADQMVKLHGIRAEMAAEDRAEAMLQQGNAEGYFIWKRIVDIIRGSGQ